MLRLTIISLALLVCTANANLFGSILGSEKEVVVVDEKAQLNPEDSKPSEETGLAVIDNDTPIAMAMDDLGSEGQSNGVVIRAKRYYGCGCGCCGCCGVTCPTPDPTATQAPCGCGCCGCGYG